MAKVDYINVKCINKARKKVYAKVKKKAEDKGIDMTDLIIMDLDQSTKEYDDWYKQQHEGAQDESLESD